MAEDFEYDFKVSEDDLIIRHRKDLPSDIFFIQIKHRKILCRLQEGNKYDLSPMGPLTMKSFWVSKASLLVDYGAGVVDLYDELDSMEVPDYFICLIIEAVCVFARNMISESSNSGRKVLPIVLEVAALKIMHDTGKIVKVKID